MDQVGLRSASSWSEDVADIVNPEIGPERVTYLDQLFRAPGLSKSDRTILLSSVGTIGLQLGWDAFLRRFESHRILDEPVGTTVLPSLSSACEGTVVGSAVHAEHSTSHTEEVATSTQVCFVV